MADFSVKKISPKLGGERGTRNPNGPTSSHDLVEQMEFLYVEIIKGKAIKNNSVINPIPPTCFPVVEMTLGNYKSSTRNLRTSVPNEWNQVFAFDKTKGDVLSVTLKDGQSMNNTVIGKRNFKLAGDIPSRVPPDARMAPQWYTMQNTETGYHMKLLMSIWFGTQADEVYSNAWFSDASDVSASCVINTRPKLYLAPRLCYVRVTIVSGHDLISSDGKRTPSIYVRAQLGQVVLKTGISPGSNPSWNQDLIFVASESLEGTVEISLMDKEDDQHEVCVGKLKKIKLSEMTAVKVPGSAPLSSYDVEPAPKANPAGDTRRFASIIKMRLATDQAYHVFDECSQYCSDYRAFAKGLWSGTLGKLEVGILGATGLTPMKNSPNQRNAYVVAKYGNKWARTRTVVDNASPKWNEQYSWDVYDTSTMITIGVYDNQQIVSNYHGNDAPIGKVRIRLSKLEWNKIYTDSYPILELGREGLKKKGELQLAVRCVGVLLSYAFLKSPFGWMLPKAHYKNPLSLSQIEALRAQAVEVNCMNLVNTEPPLRNEVVKDVLKPKSNNFSLRKAKANFERLNTLAMRFYKYSGLSYLVSIRSTTDSHPKIVAFALCVAVLWVPYWIRALLWFPVWYVCPFCAFSTVLYECFKLLELEWTKPPPPPPLVLVDLKLSKLESPNIDELDEEFDTFPSSEQDVDVLRMRYDRLRKLGEKVTLLMGDVASQCERLCALWTRCCDYPFGKSFLAVVGYLVLLILYTIPFEYVFKLFLTFSTLHWLNFPWDRVDLPPGINNFFRRLPNNEDLII